LTFAGADRDARWVVDDPSAPAALGRLRLGEAAVRSAGAVAGRVSP
jgi:hypothetical protein